MKKLSGQSFKLLLFCLLLTNKGVMSFTLTAQINYLSPISIFYDSIPLNEFTYIFEEEDIGRCPHAKGLDTVRKIATENPDRRILILINGNQGSGKTKFVRNVLRKETLTDLKPALVDEDAFQMNFYDIRYNYPKMQSLIHQLFKTSRIVIYDGINSYKTFKLIRDDLRKTYGKEGFIAINLGAERHGRTPNLDVVIFRSKAVPMQSPNTRLKQFFVKNSS